jgi:serine/threonine protein kinase
MTGTDELRMLYDNIKQAVSPEDVFGSLEGMEWPEKEKEVKAVYRRISLKVHPDHCPQGFKEMANEAFAILAALNERAQAKIKDETYGSKREERHAENEGFIIKTKKREYFIDSIIAQGDLSTVYAGRTNGDSDIGRVAVKVVDDPADNDLMLNEIRALKHFQSQPANQSKHLPVLLDQFKTSDGQIGIVLHYLNGTYSFTEIRNKYKEGIPEKHMVWMLNRLLSVLGYAHDKGVVHCNIDPDHLLVRPKDHNLFLIDWSYASMDPASTGDGFKVLNEKFSAPEVKDKMPPLPASDLYSVGKCMIYALGGKVRSNELPRNTNERIKSFIRYFVLPSPLQRAQDAWELHGELNELVVDLWGPKRFLEFEM